MKNRHRPDLSARFIVILASGLTITALCILLWLRPPPPGSTSGQLSGAIGALLLLAPLVFSIMKRSGLSTSPPTWFVAHVLSASIGCGLIFIHVAGGDWITPPGAVLLFLVFLILQGSLLRAVLSPDFSLLFARSSAAQGFVSPGNLDKEALQAVIDAKIKLLAKLDDEADESLFSPALKHWLSHPLHSLHYQMLAEREAGMVGARSSAGVTLAWSRRLHMFAALGFYLGLLAHVVVVLFFAGYAAAGETIDWWHITAWGK